MELAEFLLNHNGSWTRERIERDRGGQKPVIRLENAGPRPPGIPDRVGGPATAAYTSAMIYTTGTRGWSAV